MNIRKFQSLSKRTMPKVGDIIVVDGVEVVLTKRDIISNYAMGLTGESGEVSDLLKKFIHHGHSTSKETLMKEMGDVMHYLTGLATLYDIDIREVLDMNIEKLVKRYPNGFNKEDSIKRIDHN